MFRSAHMHIMRAAKECCRRTFSARLLTFTASVSIIFWNEPIKRMKTTANAVVFHHLESAASKAIPQSLADASSNQHHLPSGGEQSNAAARKQSAAEPPSLARYGVRAVDRWIETQGPVAKPRTPHLHCAARAALQAQSPQCRGSRGTPLAFLWGFQRGYSLRKENTPFVWQWRSAPHDSRSARQNARLF